MKRLWMLMAAVGCAVPVALATDTPPTPSADVEAGPAVAGLVSRAQLTRAVKDHEPVDAVSTLTNDQTRIAYFTEIHNMTGETVVHRWEYQGKVILEVPIKVGTARWRAYSTKTLLPTWTGEWKVSVVDAAGGTLSVNTFSYLKKPESAPSPMASQPKP